MERVSLSTDEKLDNEQQMTVSLQDSVRKNLFKKKNEARLAKKQLASKPTTEKVASTGGPPSKFL